MRGKNDPNKANNSIEDVKSEEIVKE